jgi:hypothetical protein
MIGFAQLLSCLRAFNCIYAFVLVFVAVTFYVLHQTSVVWLSVHPATLWLFQPIFACPSSSLPHHLTIKSIPFFPLSNHSQTSLLLFIYRWESSSLHPRRCQNIVPSVSFADGRIRIIHSASRWASTCPDNATSPSALAMRSFNSSSFTSPASSFSSS